MKKNRLALSLVSSILLGTIAVTYVPDLWAAHACYQPNTGFGEVSSSGAKFSIWNVPGANATNGVWIQTDTLAGQFLAAYAQESLAQAQEKGLEVHLRFGDDGYFWSVSDPMPHALCLQQGG